ncbi:MAG: endonuclease VII domain-containing protein [Pseudomonadota bacterium]
MWKPEYAATRKAKGQDDVQYRLKRNMQSISNPEARKLYMQEYFKRNPDKFKLNEEQMKQKNERRRARYAKDPDFREETKAQAREWQQKNPEKSKAGRLMKTYGMSLEKFNLMMDSCNHSCEICGHQDKSKKNVFPVVDHCHTNGHVRGILCSNCNTALGKFKDSIDLLSNAISYLNRSKKYSITK